MNYTMVTIDGEEYCYETLVNYMVDELREELHLRLAPCTEQEFAEAYCEEHLKKYGYDIIDLAFNNRLPDGYTFDNDSDEE